MAEGNSNQTTFVVSGYLGGVTKGLDRREQEIEPSGDRVVGRLGDGPSRDCGIAELPNAKLVSRCGDVEDLLIF
jgi:hypothetical protein